MRKSANELFGRNFINYYSIHFWRDFFMQVTEVNVFPVNEEKLKAYVTITFDNCFVVRDLKIINGKDGLFIAMPSKKRKDGTFKDTAHPLNNETRDMIESAVLAAYEAAMDNQE